MLGRATWKSASQWKAVPIRDTQDAVSFAESTLASASASRRAASSRSHRPRARPATRRRRRGGRQSARGSPTRTPTRARLPPYAAAQPAVPATRGAAGPRMQPPPGPCPARASCGPTSGRDAAGAAVVVVGPEEGRGESCRGPGARARGWLRASKAWGVSSTASPAGATPDVVGALEAPRDPTTGRRGREGEGRRRVRGGGKRAPWARWRAKAGPMPLIGLLLVPAPRPRSMWRGSAEGSSSRRGRASPPPTRVARGTASPSAHRRRVRRPPQRRVAGGNGAGRQFVQGGDLLERCRLGPGHREAVRPMERVAYRVAPSLVQATLPD